MRLIDSPAGLYLRSRGLQPPYPATLRFNSNLTYALDPRHSFPALVALVQDVNRQIIGVQATYLNPEGRKVELRNNQPSRLSIGCVKGGAVRLAAVAERLVLCEGVEDGLSLMQSSPGISVWACLGTSGLRGVQLPPEVRELVIAADNDDAGKQAAEALKARLFKEGRKVAIIYPTAGFKDFNDELRGNQ